MTGKLIVIEGGDGAGKETQAQLAFSALQKLGPTTYFDFPRYETSISGKIIGKALKGEYGDFRNLHPHLASLPYTLDRVGAREELISALLRGNVLCNRYTPSNAMYQGAKYDSHKDQNAFVNFLEQLEYGELRIPVPSLVIYLYVPFKISRELLLKKKAREYLGGVEGSTDQHEKDEPYQRSVIDLYLRTSSLRKPRWQTIYCTKNGLLRPPEDIHPEVMDRIRGVL